MDRRATRWSGSRRLLLLCCIAATGLTPASAGASRVAEFDSLRGTNGFGIGAWVRGRKAHLVAARFRESPTTYRGVGAEYEASGRIDGNRVQARFGARGWIDVEFEQEGETAFWMPPRRCKGAPKRYRSGVFVGTIGFRGERGFTKVETSRVQGKLKTIPKWKCTGQEPLPPILATPSIDSSPAVLKATRGTVGHRTAFQAVAARAPGEEGVTSFGGGRIETRPRLHILRYATVFSTRDSTFLFDDALSTATLDPPSPFAGSATFADDANGGRSWRGSLTVALPGAGRVRLAGPGFSARLYRGEALDSPGQ